MTTQTTNRWRFRKQSRPYGESAETGYHALAAAIVKQAVDDYKDACEKLKLADRIEHTSAKASYIQHYENVKDEVVKFFRSQWYATLCDIPCEKILKHLGVKA